MAHLFGAMNWEECKKTLRTIFDGRNNKENNSKFVTILSKPIYNKICDLLNGDGQ